MTNRHWDTDLKKYVDDEPDNDHGDTQVSDDELTTAIENIMGLYKSTDNRKDTWWEKNIAEADVDQQQEDLMILGEIVRFIHQHTQEAVREARKDERSKTIDECMGEVMKLKFNPRLTTPEGNKDA